ncbi:MAG TPA: acyl-CoA reductase [Thermoanaerobaculia bacterium]|nr:acyl-CoA reductase [Thermoanaerobaculia bacterium]
MLRDAALPPGLAAPSFEARERAGGRYEGAVWTPEALGGLVATLAAGAPALAELTDERLLDAWVECVAELREPAARDPALAAALPRLCRLSGEGAEAGLRSVLGGVGREPAARLLVEVRRRRARPGGGPVLVVLAANLPGLAVQPLLGLLALRRPVLLKSPSAEPLLTPFLVAALGQREPSLAGALAAVTWPGGEPALEAPVLAAVERVIAYGERESLDDLTRRAPGKVVGYGPKTSLAVIAAEAVSAETAAGLAADVALFDQRGCLSVAAAYTDGDAAALARHLTAALANLAGRWPPGPPTAAELAAVQQVRLEAELRGVNCFQVRKDVAAGTVIVEDRPAFLPSPGLRTLRVHRLTDLSSLPELLSPWRGRLQGAALAGGAAWALVDALAQLGVSRCVSPGELQAADALWHNGGVHPLDVLAPPRRESLRAGLWVT